MAESQRVLVIARLHGELVEAEAESETACSFWLRKPVTLAAIREAFPFEGRFWFRLKMAAADLGLSLSSSDASPTYWVDLTQDAIEIPYPATSSGPITVEVQALALELPEAQVSERDYDAYLTHMVEALPANRPIRHEVEQTEPAAHSSTGRHHHSILNKIKIGVKKAQDSSQAHAALKTVKQGASSLWNTVKATATHLNSILLVQPSVLSDISEENLAKLSDDLATLFNDRLPEHIDILKELWSVTFPGLPYQRDSPKYKEAGFQKTDPTLDLKTSGILALRSMVYLGKTYPVKSQTMLTNNRENLKTKYPYAIVAVNVTLLLAEVLNLRDQRYLSAPAGYWEMFEQPTSFYEIFCLCFFHIDALWTAKNAVRTDFSKIIGEVKTLTSQTLSKSPKSVIHFKQLAKEAGMLSLD